MTIDKKYLLNWIGGKRLLRKQINTLIPENIGTYIEPFGGGAWVLFYKDKWAPLEIYNDLNSDLVNLFKCAKHHPTELIREYEWTVTSRELFYETLESKPETDIKKAAKFLCAISLSFGGKGQHFGISRQRPIKKPENTLERIKSIHKRLSGVILENLSFEKIIEKYDLPCAFFYCDPPYTEGAGYEVTSCEDFDHEKLCEVLKNINGRFLLSYNDSPIIREWYKDFNIIETSRQKGINNKCPNGREYKELLIMNY